MKFFSWSGITWTDLVWLPWTGVKTCIFVLATFSKKMFLTHIWNCVIKECVSSMLLDRRSVSLWRINLDSCPLLVGITKNCTWRRTEEDPSNTSRSLEGDKSSCNQLVSFWFSSYPYHECKRFTYEESKMKMSPWIQGSIKVFHFIIQRVSAVDQAFLALLLALCQGAPLLSTILAGWIVLD